jgi:ABC-type multidrug transport system fused ATPase/permease subunit
MNNPALERVHRDHTSVVPERLWGQSLELQAKRAFSSIRFEGVCFEYANAPNAAIQDLNLEIKRGECIGIVGRSGSGKSTLAAMLAALLLPTRGRVFVDGVDMQSNIRHWRRRVAYVQQNPKLLEDTIRANVAFGVPDEFIDDSRVRQCLDDVGLGDLVRALNNGLHETIGEKGVRFSGGEAQKLAIARAIYRSASVLVLDESTSSLDQESQEKIVDLVSGLKGRMTIVAIAHRTRTLQICDTIAVMDKGRLVALGPRESLADEHQVLFEDGARA